jgi:hypothetical protein
MKGIQKSFKSPFLDSMAAVAKFVQTIPIFLAYKTGNKSFTSDC